MSTVIPWHYKITGFICPEVFLPKLNTYPDIHSSEECLLLYKNMIQGKMYISATSGYLCQVKMRNADPIWFSEVGEVDVIGWMPMPKCNFEINKFHKHCGIHDHLQDSETLKLKKFNIRQFTSPKDGLPNLPNDIFEVPPLIVVKELKSTSGYDYFFSIGRWDKKSGANGWCTEHPLGHVVGWLKMPELSMLNLEEKCWSI